MASIVGLVGWLMAGTLGTLVALGFALLTGRALAGLSTAAIMRLQGARPIGGPAAPVLHRLAHALAVRAGLPRAPDLYLIPSDVPNAFATGGRADGAVALSRSLLQGLDERELAGVLAHEIAHIGAGDTTALRVAGALVETTRSVAQVGLLTCLVALFLGQEFPPLLPVAFALAPSLALLLQLRLSRRREFAADAAAVALTGDAHGLGSALCRLDRFRSRLRYLGYGLGAPPSWLSTHPPTKERLERLRRLQPGAALPLAPQRTLWSWCG